MELTAFNALKRAFTTFKGFLEPIICKRKQVLKSWMTYKTSSTGVSS